MRDRNRWTIVYSAQTCNMCKYICIYIYLYTYIYVYIYTFIYLCICNVIIYTGTYEIGAFFSSWMKAWQDIKRTAWLSLCYVVITRVCYHREWQSSISSKRKVNEYWSDDNEDVKPIFPRIQLQKTKKVTINSFSAVAWFCKKSENDFSFRKKSNADYLKNFSTWNMRMIRDCSV